MTNYATPAAPRTAAGRELVLWAESDMGLIEAFGFGSVRDAVLAIEAEAAAVGQDALLSFLGTPNASVTGADYKRAAQTLQDYLAETAAPVATHWDEGDQWREDFDGEAAAPAAPGLDVEVLAEALRVTEQCDHEGVEWHWISVEKHAESLAAEYARLLAAKGQGDE